MTYLLGYNLTSRAETILTTLLSYRGATAKQLTQLVFSPSTFTLSEEKSIYNSLRKLKDQGLVSAHKLQANVANGSLYFLTSRGYEITLDLLDIDEGKKGSGWLPHDHFSEFPLADLPYEIYSPPKKQIAHHLMLTEFFIRLEQVKTLDREPVLHRSNLYASLKYNYKEQGFMKVNRYRPDGEIRINTDRFAIEIDRAMESHEQLVSKFKTYKQYLDHCRDTQESDPLRGIIFVVESARRFHGIRKRWTSILSAFLKTMGEYIDEVNLILCPMDNVARTIELEGRRGVDEVKKMEIVTSIFKKENIVKKNIYHYTESKEFSFAYTFNHSTYKIWFCEMSHEFESGIYTKYLSFIEKSLSALKDSKKHPVIKDHSFERLSPIIVYDHFQPFIVTNFEHYNVNPPLAKPLAKFKELTYFHNLNPVR
ncbi:replication-relaxation family protein [Planococcus sp. MERTA32b]|nr:replication-relaxation family protein [Planococcus sp. MER TA 32b]